MSERLNERLALRDICKDFEWEHRPDVLIVVEPGFGKHQWVIHMGACNFSADGKFSKEASRTVIFGRENLKEQVLDVLNGMYAELYDV